MDTTDFFEKVCQVYQAVKIKKEYRDFYKIDTLVYYYADEKKCLAHAKDVYEIDLRAAFPSICRHLFKNESSFLKQLNELWDDKLARNIFISTTLKGTSELKQLGFISKMIISSILMSTDSNPIILELKKDGIIYSGKSVVESKLFKKYTNLGFEIRETKYKEYCRYQRTSHYLTENNELIIKGVFKDRPEYLKNILLKIFLQEEVDFKELMKIYSNRYFDIIKLNNLVELLKKYYICEGNKILDKDFRYNGLKNLNSILPKNYLKLFIYPILVELKNVN